MSCVMIYDVLCHEMTMYCCEDYGLSWIMSKFVLRSLYICIYYVTYFGGSSSGEAAKTDFI
jgi:hypothetical protein